MPRKKKTTPPPAVISRETTVPEITVRTPGEPITKTHRESMGPVLGVFIIVLAFILGGLYLWGNAISENQERERQQSDPILPNNEPETVRSQANVEILGTVSSSDELTAIEADVLSTNLDTLGAELIEMENELTATYP